MGSVLQEIVNVYFSYQQAFPEPHCDSEKIVSGFQFQFIHVQFITISFWANIVL